MDRSKFGTRGAALVEFAILLPLLVALFISYWNLLVSSILTVRDELASTQVELDFQQTPLKAAVVEDAAGTRVLVVQPLSDEELLSESEPVGLLPTLNDFIQRIHANAGTGAQLVTTSVASELWYFHICRGDKDPCTDAGVAPGDAYEVARGGLEKGEFVTSPVATDCFKAGLGIDVYKQHFREYVDAQIDLVLKEPTRRAEAGHEALPFGTTLMDVDTKLPSIGVLVDYLEWRPLAFIAQCSLGPQLGVAKPVVKFTTIFFDKQVSKPII